MTQAERRRLVAAYTPTTIAKLSEEYAESASLIWERICALKEQCKELTDEAEINRLTFRAKMLRAMYRDTREVARYLARYYIKFVPRPDKPPVLGIKSLYPMDHRRRK